MLNLRRKEVISMKMTVIAGFCVILAPALVATVALAWGPGFGPMFGRGFGGPANGVPPIPDLTAEQSAQIQALRDGFLKEIEPLREELYTKGTELRSVWSSPNPDAAAVTAKQKEISDLQAKLQEKGTTFGLEIRKVLTPEQSTRDSSGFSDSLWSSAFPFICCHPCLGCSALSSGKGTRPFSE
jgi:Spy/CpxP family protein refolding chaperone